MMVASPLPGLSEPRVRKALCTSIPNQPRAEDRELLLLLFGAEMLFRDALWHGRTEDEGDHYENIYECAFLIYRMSHVEDVFLLWEAKRLNMDVGASLGAEYFVGAGVRETLEYLGASLHEKAGAIHSYLEGHFSSAEAFEAQSEWEEEQLRYHSRNVMG